MIFEIILLLLIFSAYKLIVKPWRKLNWYQKQFESLGYSVWRRQFSLFRGGSPFVFARNYKLYGDAAYDLKYTYVGYDIYMGNLFNKVFIWLINPQLIKQFYSNDKLQFFPKPNDPNSGIANVVGFGILYTQGQRWKIKRKVMTELFNFNFIKKKIPDIVDVFKSQFDQIEKSNEYPSVEIFEHLTSIFGSITGKLFFGQNIDRCQIDGQKLTLYVPNLFFDLFDAFKTIQSILLGYQGIKLGTRKLLRSIRDRNNKYRAKIRDLIREKTWQMENMPPQNSQSKDLLSGIYKYNQSCVNAQDRYSEQQIVEEIANLFFAGTDTTSHYLQMMIYYLGIYPEIRIKALKQVAYYIVNQQDITYQNLKKLTYIECIQKQTTRHFGPVNMLFPRIVKKDTMLKDLRLKEGTRVNIACQVNHYDPRYFEDPHQFKPERWIDPDAYKNINPYAYLGFSAGPRSCIGKQLALLSSKIGLALWLLRYQWKMQNEKINYTMNFIYSPDLQKISVSKRSLINEQNEQNEQQT